MREEECNSLEALIKRRNLHPTHAACDAIIAFAREVLREIVFMILVSCSVTQHQQALDKGNYLMKE